MLRLYLRLIGARVRAQMLYKVSFLLLVVSSCTYMVLDLAAVVVFFQHVPSVAGWSLWEVALLYALAYTSFSVAETLARGFDQFHQHVVQGTFDRVLVRPLGAFFQMLASELPLHRFSRLVQGLLVFYVAQHQLGIVWTPDRLAVLALALASGTAIFAGLFVIGAASCFWTVQSIEAVNVLTNGGVFMTTYPLEAYTVWLRRLVTFLIPVAFVNYYPALYILGRDDALGLPDWARLASPIAALATCAVAVALWSAGVRRYQSTGT